MNYEPSESVIPEKKTCGCKAKKEAFAASESPGGVSASAGSESSETTAPSKKSCGCKGKHEASGATEQPGASSASCKMHSGEKPQPKPAESNGEGHNCKCGEDHSKEAAPAEPGKTPCKCKGLLKYRRIHSLCGLLIGLFLCEHLFAVSLGLAPNMFERYVANLHAFVPRALFFEVAGIFVPLIVLIPLGLYLLWGHGMKYDVNKCERGNKLQFFLQRVTALILLAFIVFHVCTLHPWGVRLLEHQLFASADAAAPQLPESLHATTVENVRTAWRGASALNPINLAVAAFYLLGTWAAVYHLCNGLWSGATAWGVTKSPVVKYRWGVACTALGVALGALGFAGWFAFAVAPAFAL